MKKLKNWMQKMTTHPKAPWVMSGFSFAESSFSPLPPDPMLIAMMINTPKKSWFFASLCTAASVIGGVFGYAIGYFLFESIGTAIIDFYNLHQGYETFKSWFDSYGFWIIVVKGLTPIPYKLVTITCGAIKLDLFTFVLSSFISRGMRYYFEAFIIWRFGEHIGDMLKKYSLPLILITVTLTIFGFVIIKYLI